MSRGAGATTQGGNGKRKGNQCVFHTGRESSLPCTPTASPNATPKLKRKKLTGFT